MNFSEEDIQQLLDLAKDRRVYLEGNIVKIIKTEMNQMECFGQAQRSQPVKAITPLNGMNTI